MAKAIMIQGTMSNAGKSLLCAGLCRIFKQDGYRVAPFKSQNMALNSFITDEGLEMGRAQAVQAEAAGIAPCVYMNPILLKPVTNMGSQVIVNGKVLGNMKAAEYYKMKHTLVPDIMEAFCKLSEENDIIVIEGAGSPAEINLKKGDFVNMGMAKLAKAPVLLVGDIDRGGVFAQLYGTVKLLEQDEQEMIKALVINKFRGDVTLLEDGLRQIEKLTDKKVAGVVPMLDVDIDDEDSLSERFKHKAVKGQIDIAVIKLNKISNFTDFAALEAMEGVAVRYIFKSEDLGNPDLIILPGTKNTIEDLLQIRANGLEALIKKQASQGTAIIGICGGYQMLGETVCDEAKVESDKGSVQGIGLLPMDTVFSKEKQTTQTSGWLCVSEGEFAFLNDMQVKGYEIHMGQSVIRKENGAVPFVKLCDGTSSNSRMDGCIKGNVFGTYLHGFFDEDDVRNSIIQYLADKKGVELSIGAESYEAYKERQYDLLAAGIRESLDMDLIYQILENGV